MQAHATCDDDDVIDLYRKHCTLHSIAAHFVMGQKGTRFPDWALLHCMQSRLPQNLGIILIARLHSRSSSISPDIVAVYFKAHEGRPDHPSRALVSMPKSGLVTLLRT